LDHPWNYCHRRVKQALDRPSAACESPGKVAKSLTLFLVGTSLAAASAPVDATARSFVIRGDERIGTFAVKTDGTFRGAIRAFGTPSGSYGSGETCTAIWRQYGLTIFFYNLGGQDACVPKYGYFSKAIMAKGIWRTASGLRVGMPTRAIRRYHPNATFHRGIRYAWPSGWWLVTRTSYFGDGGQYPGLLADTRRGRVFALQVRYPAGGD
jgi:hypothetical protein